MALITIPLAHGGGPKTLAAVLGTAASLLLTVLLACSSRSAAHLTGLASEEASFLQLAGANLSLQGLLLAGMVIGALGVLDDVTVSQASTVLALRAANPTLGFRRLFSLAQHVGRDHVSATVNTLVLAYVGASLPILLIFHTADLGVGDALTTEIVATQVVGDAGGVDRADRGGAAHDGARDAAGAGRGARGASGPRGGPRALALEPARAALRRSCRCCRRRSRRTRWPSCP